MYVVFFSEDANKEGAQECEKCGLCACVHAGVGVCVTTCCLVVAPFHL